MRNLIFNSYKGLKIQQITLNTFYVFSDDGLTHKKTGKAEWSWGPFKTFDKAKDEINRLLKIAK